MAEDVVSSSRPLRLPEWVLRAAERLQSPRGFDHNAKDLDEALDCITSLCRDSLKASACLFTVFDGTRKVLKSAAGLPPELHDTCFDLPMCSQVVASGGPLVISDLTQDPIYRNQPQNEAIAVVAYLGVPVANSDGKIVGTYCALETRQRTWIESDVAQVRRFASLIESQIKLSKLFDQRRARSLSLEQMASLLPGVIYQYRARNNGFGAFLCASDGVRTVFGLESEACGKQPDLFASMRHPADSACVKETISEAIQNGMPWKDEYRIIWPDGTARWVHERAFAEREDDGSTIWYGLVSDITDHRQFSEELKLLSDNLPESVVFQLRLNQDDQFQFTYASAGVVKFHGLSVGQIKSDPDLYFQQMGEGQQLMVQALLFRSAREMTSVDTEVQFNLTDGAILWVHLRASPRADTVGRVLWDASETNITERKRLEALEKRANRALATLSKCNEIIALAGSEQEMITSVCDSLVSDGGYIVAWMGYPEFDEDQSIRVHAVSGTSKAKIDQLQLSWGDNDRGQGPTGTVLRTGKTGLSRKFPQPAHTSTPWATGLTEEAVRSVIAFRLNLESQEPGVLTIYAPEDLDFDDRERGLLLRLSENLAFGINSMRTRVERRRALDSLAEATERLSIALSAAALGVWKLNATHRTMEWDPKVFALFDLPAKPETPSFEAILSRVHPEDRAFVEGVWLKGRASGRDIALRFRVMRGSGEYRHAELKGIIHTDSDDRSFRALGVIQDITDVVASTTEAVQLRAQLVGARKMEALGKIASGVAHDFNNLLTGINGLVEMASFSLPDHHEASDLLREAKAGAINAQKLVSTILDFSRRKDGEEHCRFDLCEVVKQIKPLISAAMPDNVMLRAELESHSIFIQGDPNQLRQVLINLCINAAHAIGNEKGTIELALTKTTIERPSTFSSGLLAPGAYARLSVKDTGCGMDGTTLGRLFERYFTTRSDQGGTGLGLTIVKDVVVAHKGAVDVESIVGEGTLFVVYLPLSEAKSSTVNAGFRGSSGSSADRRILVIDDEKFVLEVLRTTLPDAGFDPDFFSDPKVALTHFRRDPGEYALLLVDQNMPGMDGWQFAKEARRLNPELQVTVMSGEPVNTAELEHLGFFSIKKPFRHEDLVRLLSR